MNKPHEDKESPSLGCGVITVSDTRTKENDHSGAYITENLVKAGHRVLYYSIIPDETKEIIDLLQQLCSTEVEVIIFNGGTGIAPRDTTYDALARQLEKTLPGFGELFRYLSYQEVGSRAMASRATAGIYRNRLVFSLPGSTGAVKLAMEKLIQPELVHLVGQISGATPTGFPRPGNAHQDKGIK